MPPNVLSVKRFIEISRLAVQRTPRLLQCTPASLIGSLIYCSQLGLEPDPLMGHVYLIPYWNKKLQVDGSPKKGGYVCEVQIGYKGMMELARRSEKVKRFEAHVVYKADDFRVMLGTSPGLHHEPRATPDQKTIDNIVGAYAWCEEDGVARFHYSDLKEINSAKARSKSATDGPWRTDPEAMMKKTACKRLATFLPMGFAGYLATALDDLHESTRSQGAEALAATVVTTALGTGGIENVTEQEEERRQQPRAGGPFPSDVFEAGAATLGVPRAQEVVEKALGKQIAKLERGEECKKAIAAIDAEVAKPDTTDQALPVGDDKVAEEIGKAFE